jgi:Zn-dependent protease with chaperone function
LISVRLLYLVLFVFSFLKLHSQTADDNKAQIEEIKQQLVDHNLKFTSSQELTSSQNDIYKKKHKQKIEAELKMLSSEAIIASGELYLKINSIFDKIVKSNPEIPQNTRLVLYRSNDFNAFTMGDNIVFVHIGLLHDLKNEAQIALVISHEIAHNTLRHVEESLIESVKRETDKELEKEINGILRTEYGRVSSLNALLLPRILESREKSRSHEFEADSLGLLYLKNAQFNLSDALSMFHAMEKRTKNISDSLDYSKYLHFQIVPTIALINEEYERESSLGSFTKDESKLPYLATHPYDRERFYKLATILKLDTTFNNYSPKEDIFQKELNQQIGIEMIQNSWRNKNISEVIYYAINLLEKSPENQEAKEHLALAFKSLAYLKKKRVAGKFLQLQNPKFPEDFDRVCALTYAISPLDCKELFEAYKKEITQFNSPQNELIEIIQQVEAESYDLLEISYLDNKQMISNSFYSFILEEIEIQLNNSNMKLYFIVPKSKTKQK